MRVAAFPAADHSDDFPETETLAADSSTSTLRQCM